MLFVIVATLRKESIMKIMNLRGVSEVNVAIREIAGGNKGNNSKNWT